MNEKNNDFKTSDLQKIDVKITILNDESHIYVSFFIDSLSKKICVTHIF